MASIVEMVLMTTTYNFFVRMMIAAANTKKLQENLASMRDRAADEPEPEPEPQPAAQVEVLPDDFEDLGEFGGVE